VRTAWLALGAVGAALVVVSVVLADRLARSVTRPVSALADASHRLGSGDITARVAPDGPPEIADVGVAFNRLAARVEGLLHAEREDVADLAHRLRSPLTALRLQIDQVEDPALRGQLGRSADDLARALDRLIAEARRTTQVDMAPACDLRQVVVERAAFWQALADEQARPTGVDVTDQALPVAVSHAELSATLDVLLENVFAHTPEGAGYSLSLVATGSTARLRVDDAGPGFPSNAVVDRGRSGSSSSGLGLDIARRTAERGGGRLAIGTGASGGGSVELTLPLVDSPP
jgi:signal transduction histidine kinase